MRIALCDDNETELRTARALVAEYAAAHPGQRPEVSVFSGGAELLAALDGGARYQLYLLDVIMPGLSGIALAEQLALRGGRPYIIFLTTSPDFALDAFSVQARNYLLKPLKPAAFHAALDEAFSALEDRSDCPVTITSARNGPIVVPLSSIAYAEGRAHIVSYHMTGGEVVDSRTVREPFASSVSVLLSSGKFVQPHQSFAVNMGAIFRLSGQDVQLTDGTRIPIARTRLAGVKAAYIEYLSR